MTSIDIRIFLFFFIPTTVSLECFQCHSEYGGIKCADVCIGELCVVWKWKTKSEILIKQGCLSGVERRYTAKIGCRTNHLGASLCICDDGDLCNRVERTDNTLRPLPIVRLPAVQCISKVLSTGVIGSKREHVCPSNYCHLIKTEMYTDDEAPDVVSVYNCADVAEFDFDVRIKNTADLPGLYANGCYRIQYQSKQIVTDCTCSKNNCNSHFAPVQAGPVRCYMKKEGINDTEVESDDYCDGDYCFIMQRDGLYKKGCLSVDERNSWGHIKSGYRHIVGTDEWLCQGHLCNYDIKRATRVNSPREYYRTNFKSYLQYHMPYAFCIIILLFNY